MAETSTTILCVDDEQDIVDSLYDTFMDDYTVKTATSGEEALKIFDEEDIAVVITDQRMPGMEGTELLAKINDIKPFCKKILLTGYSDINAAVDAINKGSVDKYFSKPWDDEEIVTAVKHLASMYDFDSFLHNMERDGEKLKSGLKSSGAYETFLDSYPMGICVVGDGGSIEFLNRKGGQIIQGKSAEGIIGKDYNDVFSLSGSKEKEYRERFAKNDISPDRVDMEMDGETSGVLASLIFDQERVCGILFNKASNVF